VARGLVRDSPEVVTAVLSPRTTLLHCNFVEQPLDLVQVVAPVVVDEAKLWRVPKAETLADFAAHETRSAAKGEGHRSSPRASRRPPLRADP